MPVVSNTSPLLNLAVIGQLDLLRQQFGEIWIPPAVTTELRVDEALPGCESLREAFAGGWVKIEPVANPVLAQVLNRDLDAGEAEAIALALQVKATWTLIDEREGRLIAKALGLKVIGVLGVLMRAWRDGKLASLKAAMEDLRHQAGFYIAPKLFTEILQQSGEDSA